MLLCRDPERNYKLYVLLNNIGWRIKWKSRWQLNELTLYTKLIHPEAPPGVANVFNSSYELGLERSAKTFFRRGMGDVDAM